MDEIEPNPNATPAASDPATYHPATYNTVAPWIQIPLQADEGRGLPEATVKFMLISKGWPPFTETAKGEIVIPSARSLGQIETFIFDEVILVDRFEGSRDIKRVEILDRRPMAEYTEFMAHVDMGDFPEILKTAVGTILFYWAESVEFDHQLNMRRAQLTEAMEGKTAQEKDEIYARATDQIIATLRRGQQPQWIGTTRPA